MNPDILLLPGLLCDAAVWEPVIPGLPAQRCRVVDYGAADSIEAMARAVLKDTPDSFTLIGHSMGGRVAMEVCRYAPERVQRLVLMDTGYTARAPGDAGDSEREKRMALLSLAREQGMRAMGWTWLQGMVHPDRLEDAPLVESILQMIERKTPEIFEAQIRALLSRPDATPVLETLQCPTLLVCGREDAWSPVSQHEAMQVLAPQAQLSVIEQSGHMSTMEQPESVATVIGSWLQDNKQGQVQTGVGPDEKKPTSCQPE
ncbi:MAG: alpha/beta hydrolase [Oceanospirillaceae bacterium]|jgi:pimeloyl-ACP methyl ester carboxylesterase|nr:alpha/beta hydrolase [Oceanospirillaceae bacterium]